MFIKIGLLLLSFLIGYFMCCLMTVSKMNTIREEANEYIEYMRKTFEERYNKND